MFNEPVCVFSTERKVFLQLLVKSLAHSFGRYFFYIFWARAQKLRGRFGVAQ